MPRMTQHYAERFVERLILGEVLTMKRPLPRLIEKAMQRRFRDGYDFLVSPDGPYLLTYQVVNKFQ